MTDHWSIWLTVISAEWQRLSRGLLPNYSCCMMCNKYSGTLSANWAQREHLPLYFLSPLHSNQKLLLTIVWGLDRNSSLMINLYFVLFSEEE